jgi:hypothetical protein
MQEEFLSGRENQVGNSAQMDFKGTLKERRMKYQDRREVQGQDTTRLIKRMREETGLDHEAPKDAPVRIFCYQSAASCCGVVAHWRQHELDGCFSSAVLWRLLCTMLRGSTCLCTWYERLVLQ